MGVMSKYEYDSYMELFKVMTSFLTLPDLLIYLRASVPTLMNQIQKRKRSFESGIKSDYLTRLNERYELWIDKYPGEILVINVDDVNFVNNSSHTTTVLDIIKRTVDTLLVSKK